MSVILNRYSAQMPLFAVVGVCVIPLLLLIVVIFRHERSRGWVKHNFLKHPASISLLIVILIPFFLYSSTVAIQKVRELPAKSSPVATQAPQAQPPTTKPTQSPEATRPHTTSPTETSIPLDVPKRKGSQYSVTVPAQSVAQMNCDNNSGNCAGINNGQQNFTQIGEPPSIKQLILDVTATCTLADPQRVPRNMDQIFPMEGSFSYLGSRNGEHEILANGPATFSPTPTGAITSLQKFMLQPTSSLLGKPVAILPRDFSLLHIVDTAVSGGYFKECNFITLDLMLNGTNILHDGRAVSIPLEGPSGFAFDVPIKAR